MVNYEITFKHRLNNQTRTFKLGDTRSIANKEFKKLRKNLSWWWKSGEIFCAHGSIRKR